jgi:hypothetical protein
LRFEPNSRAAARSRRFQVERWVLTASAMSQPGQTLGGSGGTTRTIAPGIRTTRLVKRALDEHWPIPKKLRPIVIRRLAEVIEDTGSSPREVTSAAKALLSASKINLRGCHGDHQGR